MMTRKHDNPDILQLKIIKIMQHIGQDTYGICCVRVIMFCFCILWHIMFHLSAHICKSKKLQILIFPPSRVSRVLKSGIIQEISQRGGAERIFFNWLGFSCHQSGSWGRFPILGFVNMRQWYERDGKIIKTTMKLEMLRLRILETLHFLNE